MGKSTISMVIFSSYVTTYQRVCDPDISLFHRGAGFCFFLFDVFDLVRLWNIELLKQLCISYCWFLMSCFVLCIYIYMHDIYIYNDVQCTVSILTYCKHIANMLQTYCKHLICLSRWLPSLTCTIIDIMETSIVSVSFRWLSHSLKSEIRTLLPSLLSSQIAATALLRHSMGILHRDIKPENFMFLAALDSSDHPRCFNGILGDASTT